MYRSHINIKVILFCILLLLSGTTSAQQVVVLDSVLLPAKALTFCFNEVGETFVVLGEDFRIIKLGDNGNVLKECGGFGWNPGLFDSPVSLAPGLLKLYVADKNNHRIQIFDRNLDLLSVINAEGNPDFLPALRYPISVALNKKGETFILSEEQKTILKLDASGTPEIVFGGNNYGRFRLNNPSVIFVTADNGIAAADDTSLVLFDSFGSGLAILPIKEGILQGFEWQQRLHLLSSHSLTVIDTFRDTKMYMLPPQYSGMLLAIGIKNRQLYGLTPNSILHLSLE